MKNIAPKKRATKAELKPQSTLPPFLYKRLAEGAFIVSLTVSLFLLFSLLTYQATDPNWWQVSRSGTSIANAGGQVGAYLSDGLYWIFGYMAYLFSICILYMGWLCLIEHREFTVFNHPAFLFRASGFLLMVLGGGGLLSLDSLGQTASFPYPSGGVLGDIIASRCESVLNSEGAGLLLLSLLLVGLTWLTGLSWILVTEYLGYYTLKGLGFVWRQLSKAKQSMMTQIQAADSLTQPEKTMSPTPLIRVKPPKSQPELMIPALMPTTQDSPPVIQPPQAIKPARPKQVVTSGEKPPLSLLDKASPAKATTGYSHDQLEAISRQLEQHLVDFGIQADVVAVHPGPVVTRYELQLAAGVKVSKLTALAKDLARSLSVISVRVVEVIPGKTVVGLELPNEHRAIVRLSDVLTADVYQHAQSPLTIALGVDISGHPVVVDLGKMPHLLVAGTTGSGKSVGINAMILSLLFKSTPKEVRLIMIDPKMLELSVYDGIPHLLTPVVTDMKEAASALRWCVGEMERRYRLMAALGVRNLAGFNTKIIDAEQAGEPLTDPLWKPGMTMDETAPALITLPYVVVVIDELADMMMVVGKKVEQLIARIAQKARAAGIHLILATQRPSVDVLTGLIKSNIPTRMSFQVSSKIDSRTILDQQGAEQLLGHGDMLYLAPGSGAPLRIHGAFVDDNEVHRVANDWRSRGEPEYIDSILQIQNDSFDLVTGEEQVAVEEADPLYDEAVEFVLQTRKASISAVQRRLKVGYNRAARLVEEMERHGILGPMEGGFRDVLVSVEREG